MAKSLRIFSSFMTVGPVYVLLNRNLMNDKKVNKQI